MPSEDYVSFETVKLLKKEKGIGMKNCIATSIEQSKKLLELELGVETADMMWKDQLNPAHFHYIQPECIPSAGLGEWDLPAWSLTALLKLINDYTMQTDTIGMVFIICENAKYISNSYDEPVDAAFDMVCWLLENKYLK